MQDAGVDVSEYKFSIYDRCAYTVFLVAIVLSVAHLFGYLEFSILHYLLDLFDLNPTQDREGFNYAFFIIFSSLTYIMLIAPIGQLIRSIPGNRALAASGLSSRDCARQKLVGIELKKITQIIFFTYYLKWIGAN